MRKLFLLALLLPLAAQAQFGTARRVRAGSALPATCAVGDVYFRTATTIGFHECRTTDTWTFTSGSSATEAWEANAQTGTTYTVLTGDRGKALTFSNASAIAVTLPQAGSGFEDGWFALLKNIGAGTVTITPTTSTISGASSITLETGEFAFITSNGTNYEASTNRVTAGNGFTPSKTRTGLEFAADTAILLSRATDQAGTDRYCAPSGASGTAYTCNVTPALTAYTTGGFFILKPDVNSGAAPTLAINGLTARNLQKLSAGALANVAANDLDADAAYVIIVMASVFLVVGI